jgi:PIN domain nuclease of toxin-antitoxin system
VIALDSSALLAFLYREKGAEKVAEVAADCCISAVNLAEVLGRFARKGHDPSPILAGIESSALEIVPFGTQQAALTAALAPATAVHGLSLGDRACLALAASRGIPALTADRAWAKLDLGIDVRLIR